MNDDCESADQRTISFYESSAESYALHQERECKKNGPMRAKFIEQLTSGCRLLDLGCGAGFDMECFERAGFVVVGLDASSKLAEIARQRSRGLVRVGQFDDIDEVGKFDGIWASSSLLHVPRHALGATLGRVVGALRPGGTLCCSFRTGSRDERDQFGRYYSGVHADEIEAMLRESNAEVTDTCVERSKTLDGEDCDSVWFFVRSRAEARGR